MGASVSMQDVQTAMESSLTRTQYSNLQSQIDSTIRQLNSFVVEGVDTLKIDVVDLRNDVQITQTLDICEDFADKYDLSQDVKAMLDQAQKTSGIGALSASNQRIINRLSTSVSITDINSVVRAVRNNITQSNEVALRNIKAVDIKTIAFGNSGYNATLEQELLRHFNTVLDDKKADEKEKGDQDTSGFDLAKIFGALTGPFVAVAVVGVTALGGYVMYKRAK
ncbi:hypothetical protein PAPYR_11453 [Paratrimastix pyriformis]|uniref:Uncharacterized protein n=1 Tax=Paratrimastix pyriformis TaxID=342808 RepID=A0ABQ8U9C1_9EUKA|nr:hypothetical protein PAPYR_11453 [Paratrimastix pyriformis]